ncbi:MAG: hypothetical protein QOE36_3626 [Gaiellaceae bacterium]|nr:hypothetical protein [Gaiellaceae bacterium]
MRSRVLWRRVATALGIYAAHGLGIVGTLIAARALGTGGFGRLALVIGFVAFFQLLLDFTSEEALVKFGFRYSEREDWGRFRRLLALTAAFKTGSSLVSGGIVAALAPFADTIFSSHGLTKPMLLAALLPPLQSMEGLAASALILRSRYDLRAGFLSLGNVLRLAAIAATASHGVLATVLGLVVAQATTTLVILIVAGAGLLRLPQAKGLGTPLGEDRRTIVQFVLHSTVGTGIVSLRGWIAPLLLGVVQTDSQVGLFKAAQAPQTGFAALSSPVRLILLTEQTRDWERGKPEVVLRGIKRYTFGAAALMIVVVGPLIALMPWFVHVFLTDEYQGAVNPARLILVAAAIQLVFGWSKSFPVSIGRPGLRIVAHGIETLALIPLLLLLGARYGATGASGAVLGSTIVFAAVWAVMLLRIRRGGLLTVRAPDLPPELRPAVNEVVSP